MPWICVSWMLWFSTLFLVLGLCVGGQVLPTNRASAPYVVGRTVKTTATWPEYDAVGVTVADINADGSLAWSQNADSGDMEVVGGNTADSKGNLYVVGSTRGNLTTTPNAGSFDLFVIKLNPLGDQVWQKQIGTPQHDEARNVVVVKEDDGNEYLYVVGVTYGALDENLHVNNGYRQYGGRDLFMFKFDVNGNKLWSRQFGTSIDDYLYGLTYDAGQLLVAGGAGVQGTKSRYLVGFNTSGAMLDMVSDGGITILPIQMRLAEAAQTIGKYNIVLNRKPIAPVTISIQHIALVAPNSQLQNQVIFSPPTLVFNSSNWNIPQYVSVQAIDDSICEYVHYAKISHSVSSGDPHFTNDTPFVLGKNLTFTITDNDYARVKLSRQHLFTVEGGVKDSYSVVLSSEPWQDVIVTALALWPTQTQLAPNQLTFTRANWNTSQVIVVQAADDSISENEFNSIHTGGNIVHYSSSLDCNYNTRLPSCYYLATCNCSGAISRGNCSQAQNSCQPGVPTLVCDTNTTQATLIGNGVPIVRLSGGNLSAPVMSIPVRYGAAALNPNPPTTTTIILNSDLEQVAISTRQVQYYPPPFDNGWGGVWTNQTINKIDTNANPNPLSYSILGLNLSAIPADVAGFVYSFMAVDNGQSLATLSQSQRDLIWAMCIGIQRLTTQRWAFDEWPPGMADRVLDALTYLFPTVQKRHLWNCGGSHFTPDSQLDVNIFDNDPGITLSDCQLQVTEGGSSVNYSVVLNAPPYQISGGSQTFQSFCASNATLDQCRVNFTQSSYIEAFNAVQKVNDSVTIVARSNKKITITPPYLSFTNDNWFLPQVFSVTAIDDLKDSGSLNTTIMHDIYPSSASTMNYINASFWVANTLPLNNASYLTPALPYNSLPTIYNGPNHRIVQVFVQENDRAAVVISTSSLSIKEIQVKSDYNTVGDVNHGICTDSLTVSTMSGIINSVLIFAVNQSSFLRFHVPYLHHNTFQSSLGAAFIELAQTKYTVVNMTWLNISASLNPSFLVEVSLIQSNWTEANFTSPVPLPLQSVVQNVTMIDSIVRIDVTKLIHSVSASFPIMSFRVNVLSASDNVQLYAKSDPENIMPELVLRKQYPNLLLNQSTYQDTNSISSSAAAVDGDVTKATSVPFNWWQVNLTNVQALGTLAVFVPTNFTAGSITIVVSTQPFDISFNLTSPPTNTILRTFTLRRPVFIWQISTAGQFIRIYTNQIPLAEVQLYARGINITTTDDGYGIRLTDRNVEAKVNPDYEQRSAWQLASGSYSLQDNLANGMPTTQSSVNLVDPPTQISTLYETNPWWHVDLGSTQSISMVTLEIARTIPETTACAYPATPTKPNTISSFTSARIRLSDNLMNATVNTSSELVQTISLSQCFNLTLSWKLFASGRHLRVDFIGNGSLNIATYNVERWSTKFSQYALLELRGSSGLPLAFPNFSFLDPKKNPISYQVFSTSTSQNFNGNQPWGTKCYLGTGQREWIIVDFFSIQQLDNLQLSLSPSLCSNNQSSVDMITALSIAVYGDPILMKPTLPIPLDACACQSDNLGQITSTLPANCQNFCSSIQCTSNICNNGVITQSGVTLSLAGFHDIVVLANVLSLPCLTLPLSRDAYSLMVLRDEPLVFIQLTLPFKEINMTISNVTLLTTGVFPLGYAALQSSNSSLIVENVFKRTPWFGISYINTRDSSFTLEFWVAVLSQNPGPIVNYVSSGSTTIEIGISKNLSSYFTLTYQGITTTLVGPLLPLSISANNASWVHMVASYDWKAQTQYFYVNTWTVETSQVQTTTVQGSRNDTIVLAIDGKLVFAPTTPCWLAKVAWYERSLSNYEVLEHFFRPTPIQTYGMFTVSLATNPVNPVDISFITESSCYRWGLCNTSVQPSSLHLTAETWNKNHYVYIHGTDDFMAEGVHSDTIFNEIKSTPSIAISTQVATPIYSNAPGINVTSFFSTWVLNQTALSYTTLSDAIGTNFGSIQANWSQQTLSTSQITLPAYSNLSATLVGVQLTDINVATVEISSYYLSITENGLRDIFQVVLTAEPKSNVTIQFNASTDCYRKCGLAIVDDPCPFTTTNIGNETLLCNCTVVPNTIIFTPQNWELPQPITVIPTDDRLQEGALHYTKIVPTTTSLDPVDINLIAYNKLFLESIRVAIADNDVSKFIISSNSISLSENDTTTDANYTVVLTTEPWSEVNLTISNEATGGCYRTCGYPIDPDSCGLPRPLATNSIEIMTTSVREIQAITASMTTTNGVQLITTTTTHIDPIFTVQITGGYALPQYKLTISYPNGVVLAASYGSNFRISTANNVSPNLDGFISAIDLQTALNALQAGFTVTRTTKSVAPALILEWRIAYSLTSPTMPTLVFNSPASFTGTGALTLVISQPTAPGGMLGFNYGPIKGPLTLTYGASASQLASYLEAIPGINTVSIQRTSINFGYEYSITFTSVPVYYSTLTVDTSLLQVDINALSSININSTYTRQPNQIGGWYVLQYRVNSSYVGTSLPLQYNSTSQQVVSALQGIPTLGLVQVQQRQLTPELTYTWTVEFSGNVGPVANLTASSLNLTGLGSNVAVAFIQQGDQLGGFFTLQLGGLFQNSYPTGEVFKKMILPRTTSPLPFNANSSTVQKALLNLQLDTSLTGLQVNRIDSLCDIFGRCQQYSWQITFAGTPGNIPQIVVQSNITGTGAQLTPTTIANGTYLTGNFTITLQLNDSGTIYSGTTWQLPINVTSDGVKEALEALPFITSDRAADSSFDPANPTAIPKATKGVRVTRTGPYLDGGYKWLLDWSLNDWERFTNINITTNITFVGQDIVPIEVATQYSANGPRCASYINTVFLPDTTDPFDLFICNQ
uniref:Secreted protein n=1 Tax=Thraustotheca clavata TaxID=74557 RepID=A0A0A7CLW9_9STRA|nr:secreted protein [Thraustotheca clavata]